MNTIVHAQFRLPHVPIIIEQTGNKNLLINLGTYCGNCSLKESTGKISNPVKGQIHLGIRFISKDNNVTKKVFL